MSKILSKFVALRTTSNDAYDLSYPIQYVETFRRGRCWQILRHLKLYKHTSPCTQSQGLFYYL